MVDVDDIPEAEIPLAAAPDDPDEGGDDDPALEEIHEDGGTPEDDVPSLIVEDPAPEGLPGGV